MIISSDLGGSVIVKGLVSELEGIDPSDPFFDETQLIKFLTDVGEDGDGKGVISFEDKSIATFDCDADQANAFCEVRVALDPFAEKELSLDNIGDTTISTTELQVAQLYVEQDQNVQIFGDELLINLTAE